VIRRSRRDLLTWVTTGTDDDFLRVLELRESMEVLLGLRQLALGLLPPVQSSYKTILLLHFDAVVHGMTWQRRQGFAAWMRRGKGAFRPSTREQDRRHTVSGA
jgi:hypothetical protein